ncbi:hypothetical protein CTEN210_00172 [Chaetoceros tenuissimus]|uniref:HMG box domain-containing protein n=1 Tax=Chaetoceros tenuissimus TaxID=426638 RepID=A0AAD3GYW2_9STRA|nr:hypothetical protein CTEN210_00172 [Chaetoceros tenuissimus]
MTTYKHAIVVGLLNDVTNQTNVQQLQQLESKSLRIRKALSEDEQSQTFASFMRDMVTNNISYMQEVAKVFSQHDNCNVEFEFGDKQCAKVMIRKAGSASAVVSLVINFRIVMGGTSERQLCMICHDDTLLSHLACSSSEELYIVPSTKALPQFSSSFKVQKAVSKVILIAFDENDSLCDFIIDPNFDQIKEFCKNDKDIVSRNTDKSTSSSKSAKRKSTGASERANKSAKNTETAKAPQTIADTNESPIVETTKESTKKATKKSKTSKKDGKGKAASTESEKSNKAAKTTATEETVESPQTPEKEETPEKTSTDTDESSIVETSKNSTKKSSSKKEGKRKATLTESESESEKATTSTNTTTTEEAIEAPETPEKTSTDTEEPQNVETSKKSTKKSKTKDPNAPKKPTHYNIAYKNSIRSKVVEENPGLSTGDINKLLAKQYKEASDEELQPFKAVHDGNMKVYKKELEEYQNKQNEGNDDEEDVEENNKEKDVEPAEKKTKNNKGNDDEEDVTKTTKKRKRKTKEKSAIKKNVTAYMHFSMSKGPELKEKGIKPPESGKVLGTLWRALPDSERAEFEEIAKKDKERYLKEVEKAKAAEDLKAYLKKNWNSVPDPPDVVV